MKDHSSENYLDQLLNSVNGEYNDIADAAEQKPPSSEEQWERELFGEPESDEEITAKNEEDFLREFEAELLKDDMMSPFTDLGRENDRAVDDTIDDLISHMSREPKEEETSEPVVDENAEFEGTLPGEDAPEENVSEQKIAEDIDAMHDMFLNEPDSDDRKEETSSAEDAEEEALSQSMEEAVGAFDENFASIPDELPPLATETENKEPQEGEELDLSGMGDADLMDMLSDSDDLSELGDLLSSADEDKPVEDGDSIGAFAQAEMDAQEQEIEGEESSEGPDKKKRGKKKKEKKKKEPKEKGEKTGFLARLSKLFFGEEEAGADTLDEITDQTAGMSDENKKILEELEAAGELTEKKPKKEKKKKKEPKPKKPKKVKEPKPKKEKKPKEIDNTPPLPKGPVIAIVIMVTSLFGLIMVGVNLLGYQSNINLAKDAYGKGSFVEAFSELQGLKIREKDSEFYNQLQVLAVVSEKYQDYLVFENNGKHDIALDNLICAYGRYDLNKQKAQDYNCSVEYEQLGGKIIKSLLEDYDMTGEEALQMYNAKNRKEYTLQLHAKLKALGLE
ncbi:MAG: hypothetical protein MR943_05430 [Lachnobacterium sp.]|nr:hypothetical protein [Lachnobacterium sp.]